MIGVKVLVLQSIKVARLTLDKTKSVTVFLDFLKTNKNELGNYVRRLTIYFLELLKKIIIAAPVSVTGR